MIRRGVMALLWLGGLAAIGLVTYLLWLGVAAAMGMLLPGEATALALIPAAIVALLPLGWYLWVTALEPWRLRER